MRCTCFPGVSTQALALKKGRHVQYTDDSAANSAGLAASLVVARCARSSREQLVACIAERQHV